MRHGFSDQALEDTLALLNIILPYPIFCSSVETFLKKFDKKTATKVQKCYYCCESLLGEADLNGNVVCEDCSTQHSIRVLEKNKQFFLYIPVREQMQNLVDSKTFQDLLASQKVQQNDICKSTYYKSLDLDANDLTLQINTDGVSPFNSSNVSFWPLFATINEIPHVYQRRYMLLCGIWLNKTKPPMNLFLHKFVRELIDLGSDGIMSKCGTFSRIYVILVTCDSVARPCVQNINQFNGKFGCSFCMLEGEVITVGKGHARIYRETNIEHLRRNEEQHIEDAKKVLLDQESVNGVKGFSVLSLLPKFDITVCFSVEYMHCVLLGVVRTFIEFWLDGKNSQEPFYLGTTEKMKAMDKHLLQIKPPYEITRPPRSLKFIKKWKATELKNFLLYYSYPMLQNVLPSKFVSHWGLLIFAVNIYLQPSSDLHQLAEAKKCIFSFVEKIEKLYADESLYKFNTHLLLHLPENVQQFGMLWGTSAFPFEDANGFLSRLYHNSNSVDSQLSRRYLRFRVIQEEWENLFSNNTDDRYSSESWIKLLDRFSCRKFTCKRRMPISRNDEWAVLASKSFKKMKMSSIIRNAIEQKIFNELNDDMANFHYFCSLLSNTRRCIIIHSFQMKSLEKRNNSVVELSNGEIVLIQNILTGFHDNMVFLEVESFEILNKPTIGYGNSIYALAELSGCRWITTPNMVSRKIMLVNSFKSTYQFYLCYLVNDIECD
ncbi:uncharacterized protein LOC135837754 [Planococcus citri]|uniref:uncharacterized protein LOC135837754 n=1 Tax=Planococcus citri TaxID=170843 RepID=UPI0031F770ED